VFIRVHPWLNQIVRVKFLLGPAGSGKTFRCLEETRAALKKDPEGEPLIFLAPKQATFQIERQLLDKNSLTGFTRLQIFSFDRLAQFVLEKLNLAPPKTLSAEGRVMVLRALLLRHEAELKLFRQSARRPGFAQELSLLLRELQEHQFTPQKLRALAENKNLRAELRDKLNDLALLHENYSRWLAEHELQDANCLLDFATKILKENFRFPLSAFRFSSLWLDGFAEMTPQELDFLAAVIPFCQNATLAFCLDASAVSEKEDSWLSIWSTIGKTYQQCRARIENLSDAKIETEFLKRDLQKNRFAKNPALRELENCWQSRAGFQPAPVGEADAPLALTRLSDRQDACPTLTVCANPEVESVFAAREILKFVRAGNRFRDCAILVRNLENYHQSLARVFRRYGIPFFLDRRESVAHHPLAELTRSALRTVAFDWPHDDWFAALKAGFCRAEETEIDALENAALEFGWRGKKWREPLPDERFERLRGKIFPSFENFYARILQANFSPNGIQLAEFIRELWDDLNVEKVLENWSLLEQDKSAIGNRQSAIHQTVFDQLNSLLENLALGFARENLPLRDWLPIVESGLTSLTVGVIPPTLDEVLIGAVDRARNPNLKFALVLGVNESVFPAPPHVPAILTNSDRDELENANVALGANLFDQISRERFYGYIACTRASEKLTLTFSRQSADGNSLNPSPFIAQVRTIFPALEIEEFQNETSLPEIVSVNEFAPFVLKIHAPHPDPLPVWWGRGEKAGRVQPLAFSPPQRGEGGRRPDEGNNILGELFELPSLVELKKNLGELREPDPQENLSPEFAEKLYGDVLKTSVSRLEEFAACPFKFFVHSGLRANERKVFELDARERGSFQHEVLRVFHERLVAENKRWRDVTPDEGRARIAQIAAGLAPEYRDGLLHADAQSRFDARILTAALQDFVGTLVEWMRGQYEFDPVKAEFSFGFDVSPAPAWELDLGGGHKLALRGKIDRIDLCQSGERTLAVVMDYKSSQKKLDKILVEHGVQLQLLAYLAALRNWPPSVLGAGNIFPAGTFYINLRGQFESGGSREEILSDASEARRRAYQHSGRFDAGALNRLDSKKMGGQFKYRLKNDGTTYASDSDPLPRAEFENLLDRVENQLRDFGRAIFSGAAQVDPYRKGKQTPCEFCDYQAACRIDKWTHQWRVLRAEKTTEAT
jgi:ATP-dependent helicase/nuclease subunit B